MTYLKVKDFSVNLDDEIEQFALGIDNLPYVVFRPNSYAWEYAEHVFGKDFTGKIACFGHYENAVLLQDTIGL